MDINLIIARRVRDLRKARGLSLDALATRCNVSRSNISLIERGESSPTAALLNKLAAGLGVTLSSLFEEQNPAAAPLPLARKAEQPVWTDPGSGYVRRKLSPVAHSPFQLVEVTFPPGQRIAYDHIAGELDIHQQVWMIDGSMDITVGDDQWRLHAGDCLAMRLDRPSGFHNPTLAPAHYLVAVVSLPFLPNRKN